MLIDTHCHLNFHEFDADRTTIIGNAKKAGVKKFLVPGDDWLSSVTAVDMTKQYPGVLFASVGFHPYAAQEEPDAAQLEKLLLPAVLAIGECGLDYHMYKGEPADGKKYRQQKLFEAQLRIAVKRKLPVIIHCRDAFADLYSVLDTLPEIPAGVLHCFSGGLEDLRMVLERKLYIGIDGNVTYSKSLQAVVPHIPIGRLLLETDSPYLTPEPFRGKRNEPKHLTLIANKIAALSDVSSSAIGEQTRNNAVDLFRFPEG